MSLAAALILSPPALVAPAFSRIDAMAFLNCIAQVEAGGKWRKVGSKGELGAYQFRRITWHAYTDMPFRYAADPRIAPAIAAMHLERICGALRHLGLPVTALNLARVWKSGMRGFLLGEHSVSAADYAERVDNLYSEALQHSKPWPNSISPKSPKS